jgi:heat-inducible transcriptional repressor
MDLNEREKSILWALIELYTDNAGPVSSGQLQKAVDLGVSSATIRNVLHALEEKGFLDQPHTSAGRVPTRRGYQLYVEETIRHRRLHPGLRRRIRESLPRSVGSEEVPGLLAHFSRLLAGLSSNVGVSFAVEARSESQIERVEIVLLEGARLLAVVTFDDGEVRTCIVPLEKHVAVHDLEIAVQLLNEIVAGYTPAQARQRLRRALEMGDESTQAIAQAIAVEKERLFGDQSPGAVHLEGASEIMGQPEFQEPGNLRLLVRILDHPESLEPLLLEDSRDARELKIHIGGADGEGTDPALPEDLSPFSLVSARYRMAGHIGIVGILGPVRMQYSLAISLVQGVLETVRELESES